MRWAEGHRSILEHRSGAVSSPGRSAWSNSSSKIIVNGQYCEWVAGVRVNKMALNGPFSIHLVLSNDNSFARCDFTPEITGTRGVFASTKIFMNMNEILVEGGFPLTAALMDKVAEDILPGLDVESVTSYLQDRLQFKSFSQMGHRLIQGPLIGWKFASRVPKCRCQAVTRNFHDGVRRRLSSSSSEHHLNWFNKGKRFHLDCMFLWLKDLGTCA